MKKITIYSTPSCHYCNLAKDYFQEKGLSYTCFDVKNDTEKRKEMIEISGQMGVPVIKVGKKVLTGFSPDDIEAALK